MAVITVIPKTHIVSEAIQVLGTSVVPNLQRSVKEAANLVLEEWVTELDKSSAKEGWKRLYREAINIDPQGSPLETSVTAEGLSVNLVEDGVRSFSIKDGLLNGPRAKISKKGKVYTTVFIRKFGAGARKAPKSRMTPMVHKLASTLAKGETIRSRIVSLQRRIASGEKVTGVEKRVVDLASQRKLPSHIERIQKVGKSGHIHYGSFVRVSEDSSGWMYPNIPAVPVYDVVFDKVTEKVIEKVQEGLMKDMDSGLKVLKNLSR